MSAEWLREHSSTPNSIRTGRCFDFMSAQNATDGLSHGIASAFGRVVRDSELSHLAQPAVNVRTERIALIGFVSLLGYVFVRSVFQAASRPFWYDEILTWSVARQPSLAAIWRALARAADGQPPTFYLVERLFGHLVPNEHIALRLPSLVAFCSLLVCIFVWVRKHSGSIVGFVCAAAVLSTPLYDHYAIEARPYTLMAACIAFALICYERADARHWVILLGLTLMLAQSLHYYAMFPILSFVFAEFVFAVRTRKIRWSVWLAISLSLVPLALFWPLLRNFKQYYGQHYWAKPNSWALFAAYYFLLRPLLAVGGTYMQRVILTATTFLGSLGLAALLGLRSLRNRQDSQPPFQVLGAIGALLALPCTIFVGTTVAHGGFTERYTLPVVIAMAVALGYFLRARRPAIIGAVGVLVLMCFLNLEVSFWHSQKGTLWRVHSRTDAIEQLVYSAGHTDLPVVVSDSMDSLPLAYYAPAVWAGRFVVLLDPPQALRYSGSDSNEKELAVLGDLLPIRTSSFEEFKATHQTFLLYSSSGGEYSSDWWPVRLTADGYSLKILQTQSISIVYLVDLQKRTTTRN